MQTLIKPLPTLFPPICETTFSPSPSPIYLHPKPKVLPRKIQSTSKFGNFLSLKPDSKPESLPFDLSYIDPKNRSHTHFDVIVIGAGPAGLRLSQLVSQHGVRVCCIDPSPLSMWPNNYGAWVDELQSLGLEDCFDKTWPMASVHINNAKTKYLDRPYGRVNRKHLKTKILQGCVTNGVKFHQAKVWKIHHQEFESLVVCDTGSDIKASLIVDASGFASNFVEYDKPRNHGYQIAHGILAEVDEHPFDLDKMLLMDWRDSHLNNEPYLRVSNAKTPTFLYAMPFDKSLVFLEETSLVSRPALSYSEIKKRMVARLRHLGIRVRSVIEDEKCLIPMGGPLPRIPQQVMGIGGTAGIAHPSTGYMVARTLALIPVLAEVIAECLGSNRMIRGSPLHHRVWNGLWPVERRCTREFYSFGMETLLKLDLNGSRRFFDAFFSLDPHYWHGFLSSRLSLSELAMLSLSFFGHGSNLSRLDIVTKCPAPLAKLVSLWDCNQTFYTSSTSALSKIASKLGTPKQADKLTISKERVSYARVLVEVDVTQNLKEEVCIIVPNGKKFQQTVRYEYVPKFCNSCKAIGHSIDRCPYTKTVTSQQTGKVKNGISANAPHAVSVPGAVQPISETVAVSTVQQPQSAADTIQQPETVTGPAAVAENAGQQPKSTAELIQHPHSVTTDTGHQERTTDSVLRLVGAVVESAVQQPKIAAEAIHQHQTVT